MRLLSAGEIERLFTNSPQIREKVTLHNNLVSFTGWDQAAYNQLDKLPIPVRGLVTSDIWLGPLVIFPKANGELLFVYPQGYAEAQSLENEIQKLTYVSPDAGLLSMLQDMEQRFEKLGGQLLEAAVFVALLLGVAWVVK